jgi:hypothetical protein
MDPRVPQNNLVDHRSVYIPVVFLAFFFCTTSAGSDSFFERAASLPIRRRQPLCPVFLIATCRIGLPAAGGWGGGKWRDQETVGRRSSRVFLGVIPTARRRGGLRCHNCKQDDDYCQKRKGHPN